MTDNDSRQEAGPVILRNSLIALGVVIVLLLVGVSCAFCRGEDKQAQTQFEPTLSQGISSYERINHLVNAKSWVSRQKIEERAAQKAAMLQADYEKEQLAEQRKREARKMDALDEATIANVRHSTAPAPYTARTHCERYREKGARYRACLALPPPRR
ncbi:MAG: hypothetical protein Q8P35_03200 [Candidatus Yanofskybacteria bacterium]|nr:hypothetical protein [Candidatus Yanofskybacteria bacterium]